ncbi:MAG: CDP-diacylglycerol--glycerol-3-phosphate 3-phosphatidyltransferase [Planktomarina sp.]
MWTIPNILTVLRLLGALAIPMVYIYLPAPHGEWAGLILFIVIAITDFLDGYLARAWDQKTKLGAMLDPIADKVVIMIAILALVMQFGMSPWLVIPSTLIVFREVFVSGLREYLGDKAGTLAVTKLAKWKTTVQMVAVAMLLSVGIFGHYVGMYAFGMDAQTYSGILDGSIEDTQGLRMAHMAWQVSMIGGLAMLWLAAALTVVTGMDYLRKAWVYLQET